MAQISKEQRKEKVIEVLNKARSMELQAIAQYMNQHYNLDNSDSGDSKLSWDDFQITKIA